MLNLLILREEKARTARWATGPTGPIVPTVSTVTTVPTGPTVPTRPTVPTGLVWLVWPTIAYIDDKSEIMTDWPTDSTDYKEMLSHLKNTAMCLYFYILH